MAHSVRTFAFAVAFAAAAAAQAADTIRYVYNGNADQELKPGDVLIKMLNSKSQASSYGILVAEAGTKEFYSAFSTAAKKGDPKAVHVAIYVGGGQTAEAHGATDHDKEGVSLRKVEHHAGYVWYLFRPVNAKYGEDAAKVAKTWSTGRMKYKTPFDVPFHNSNFGPRAQEDALVYGKEAGRAGGPKGEDSMFCSEFVIAVYQATLVAALLKDDPKLKAEKIGMYPGMDRQARYTSPLVMHGHLIDSKKGFTYMGLVVTQNPPGTAADIVAFKGLGGRCFDAEWLKGKGAAGSGSPIHTWDCNGAVNQKWKADKGRIENPATGLCLSVDSGKLQDGQRLVLWKCHGGADQKWVQRGSKLALQGTKYCADVKQRIQANGTPVILYTCGDEGKDNQAWHASK